MIGSVLALILGIPIVLIGLVGMGPQVNVHRIRPWSIAAWVFRIGGTLMIIGLVLSLSSGLDRALVSVSLIMGTACVVSCAVIVHHEWVQAGHVGQPDFKLHFSPVLVVLWLGTMLVGVVLIIGLAANWLSSTLQWFIIIEMSIGFALLLGIQISTEKRRANFELTRSFSLQAYVIGIIILMLGLIILIKVRS
ncbi:MAG: hypothetical protein GC179_12690 [Anaerolineaceae bacterium]|nr:hypothetical protein [Anaerolineaceae bacterium]